jgi:hypothetical protein
VGLFAYSQGIFSLLLHLNIMKRSSPASFEKKKTITKINNIYHTPFDYHKHVKLIIEWPEFS